MDDKVRIFGLIVIAEMILQKSCGELKKETGLMQFKVKKIVNNLLDTLKPILSKYYTFVNKDNIEIISDEVQTQIECIELVNDIMLTEMLNVYDLHLILTNIKNGKRVFTENEVILK